MTLPRTRSCWPGKRLLTSNRKATSAPGVAQIARRLVANERRKDARRSRLLAGEVTDLLLQLAADEKSAARADRTDEFAALQGCLEQLPPHGRDLIRLRYFENLSPGTIAGHLGRPSDAVRQFLQRLRRKLLECVEGRLGLELG